MQLMRNGLVRYGKNEKGVATIELVNPPANTYSYEMMCDLDDAILEARFDEKVHVIVIRGAGDRFFCAGADIGMLNRVSPHYKYMFCLHANETLLRLEHTPKLVIAAIRGHCVGGGFEIALAADIRVAARGSGKIGLPEINLGVLPGTGGTQRLARLIGKAKAIELMIEGKLLEMDEALQLGLLHHVWEGSEFEAKLSAYAEGFCPPSKASLSVGLIKRAVQSGLEISIEQGLALERELQQRLFQSEDAREGLAAFNEKRKAEFRGF
ncbi:MAG: enoyl-CoA hydratase/isomerase family protein [Deltaproteobacteria bacterium]|nr:enoyl-CoA hydratase/isomerase family protein [Deltaproteobacteria bacterium]